MKILNVLIFACLLMIGQKVQAQHNRKPVRLSLPLMQKLAFCDCNLKDNIRRSTTGYVNVKCKFTSGDTVVMKLTDKEYELYRLVRKGSTILGLSDSLEYRAILNFINWSNPLIRDEGDIVFLIFPRQEGDSVEVPIPKVECIEFLKMRVAAYQYQIELLSRSLEAKE